MTRLLITVTASLLLCGFGDPSYFSNKRGNDFYKSEQYQNALREYMNAKNAKPGSKTPDYNIGASLYKLGKYDTAAKAFAKAMETDDSKLKKKAGFNRGTSLLKSGKKMEGGEKAEDATKLYEEAVKQFITSLKDDPTDNDARHNLELAMKQLEEMKKKQQQKKSEDQNKKEEDKKEGKDSSQKKKGDQETDKNKKADKKSDEQKESNKKSDQNKTDNKSEEKQPEQMTPEEAKRIFSAIEQDEKDLRKRMKARGSENTPRTERDW